MWEPQRPTTLWASIACYRDTFTLLLLFTLPDFVAQFFFYFPSSVCRLPFNLLPSTHFVFHYFGLHFCPLFLSLTGKIFCTRKVFLPTERGCQHSNFMQPLSSRHFIYLSSQFISFLNFVSLIDSKGFWQWRITIGITGILECVHCPVF
jgi:hypothetical protein